MRMDKEKHIRSLMKPNIEHILFFYAGVHILKGSQLCLERGRGPRILYVHPYPFILNFLHPRLIVLLLICLFV